MKFVKIYTRPQCPYCENAKKLAALLKEKGIIEYEVVDYLAAGLTKDDLTKIVGVEVKTLPQIQLTENNETVYIGGYTDFDAYAEAKNWI